MSCVSVRLWIPALLVLAVSGQFALAGDTLEFPGKKTAKQGFDAFEFPVDGVSCTVICPHKALAGRPWIWKAEFLDCEIKTDLLLVDKGMYLVYLKVGNTFGCPDAMKHWDVLYQLLTEKYGFAKKPALEGISRGGLYVYNWASANPDKVACIYGDNPVCDFKSWPGGKGKGPGSRKDWQKLIGDYKFASEAEALAYTKNPTEKLAPLAAAKVPLLHVCGDADEVVPYQENTAILKDRYEKLGGSITVIIKKGFGHHPHGLAENPTPIVEFIMKHACGAPGR